MSGVWATWEVGDAVVLARSIGRPQGRPSLDGLRSAPYIEAMVKSGDIFADVPERLADEETKILAANPGAVVERIVSTGQASPLEFWYDQDWTEWVIVLEGAARLLIEGEAEARSLGPGDYLELPPRLRHRVEWTDPARPTVWLAVHFKS